MSDGWEVRVRLSSTERGDPVVWEGYIVNVPNESDACERVRQLTGATQVEAISCVAEGLLLDFRPGEVRRLSAEF